jgi:hypothetical protein
MSKIYLEPKGPFLSERHRWLEIKDLNHMHMNKCACGEHSDDFKELKRIRLIVDSADEVVGTPAERLTKHFATLSAMGKEQLLDELSQSEGV